MAKPHCSVCGYTKEDAAIHLDHHLCKGKIPSRSKSAKKELTKEQEASKASSNASEEWWRKDGVYIDPDTEDVDWYDKRAELAKIAFMAGVAWARENNA
jgi:hypothetical protein